VWIKLWGSALFRNKLLDSSHIFSIAQQMGRGAGRRPPGRLIPVRALARGHPAGFGRLRTESGDNTVGKPALGRQALDSIKNIDTAQSLRRWTTGPAAADFHNWREQGCGQAREHPDNCLIFLMNFPMRKIQARRGGAALSP
jgi:hypothetical protein